MKAIVVTPYYFPKIGGLENYARQLNLALARRESWEIVIVTSGQNRSIQIDEVDHQRIYRMGRWFKLSNTPFNPLWPLYIRSVIIHERPDVILAHAPVPTLADAAALAAGKTPFILVYHAATLLKAGSPLFNSAARAYSLLGGYKFRRADKIFAVSEYVRTRLAPKLQAKTVVVPNSVWDADIFTRPQASNPHFIFIASLDKSHAWKGLMPILEAVALYREHFGDDIRLTVIGDGTMRAEYERKALDLGLARHVTFAGAKVGAEKLSLFRKALGMVIYPTTENDAFPTVMLEAWAERVPVIAARIGALAPLINHGKDGLLCEPKRPEALAGMMHALAEMPQEKRERMALAAASRTKKYYTWERQADLVQRQVEALV